MRSIFKLEKLRVVPASLALVLVLLLLPPSLGNEQLSEMAGEDCSEDDLAVYQGATSPLPSGIPTYTVQILNKCVYGWTISDVHVSCGWFSSAREVNPRVFRRLGFDDCLVNDGAAIPAGGSISFQYANSFPYPLTVSSVSCTRE